MGVSKKGKRKVIVDEKVYWWYAFLLFVHFVRPPFDKAVFYQGFKLEGIQAPLKKIKKTSVRVYNM